MALLAFSLQRFWATQDEAAATLLAPSTSHVSLGKDKAT